MDEAQDSRGNIVQARRGAYFGLGLVCPKCRAPVRLRQGPERRPHFAHYSNRAELDCKKNYSHPPVIRPPSKNENAALFPKHDSLRCGLFLKHRPELDAFEISLRIPSLASVGPIYGSVEIQSGHGYKSFVSEQLTKAHSVRLAPRVPLVECKGTGDLEFLADHLLTQSRSFTYGKNLFSSADSGGRLMFPEEPIEWGGRYWLVTDTPVALPDEVTRLIEWSHRGRLDEWPVYAVEIPAKLSTSRPEIEALLSEFFGRAIRPAHPRAYIVQPSPHHLAEDGAYVYPQPPEYMYVRRTSNKEVSVECSPELLGGIEVTELSDEWVQIKGFSEVSQDAVILINGIEQVLVRIEGCAFFQPGGLRAYAGDLSWDLLVNAPLSKKELFIREVRVDCRSPRLAEHIAKLNENWHLDGAFVILPENTDKALSAGGFGEIETEGSSILEGQAHEQEPLSGNGDQRTIKGMWIEGLIGSIYGQQPARLVREYLANPSQINLQRLDSLVMSPLMAYIRSALHNQQR